MLKTKSVWDAIKKEDGLRILTTRFRGRGMPKSRYHVWMANLAPSEKILGLYQRRKIGWETFVKSYKQEMQDSGLFEKKNSIILNHGQKFTFRLIKALAKRQNITLMCHCETNADNCHLRILDKLIHKI